MAKTTHIALVSSPGFSHLIPVAELAKRLVQLHPNLHVTCIIPTLESPPNNSKSYLETLPSSIDSIFLPPINKEDLPQGNLGAQIQLTVTLSLPSLHDVLKSLSSKAQLAALVADVFAFEALDFAKEFNTLSYIFFPSAAMTLSMLFYILTEQVQQISGEYNDLTEPIQIPGCVPLIRQDLPTEVQNPSSESYKQFLELAKGLLLADGILVNSFLEMESGAIRALTEKGTGKPPIYPVGPITQKGSSNEVDGSECLRWLDNQPPSSVLYISFGSGGSLSQHQVNELSLGLESSGKKFLWVLRAPSNSASDAYLGAANVDPSQFLPSGFLERTKEQGLVVPSWAPQLQVLSHNSVGGFLSHCGWNSILESVLEGVPLITWPLFAEQRMNAVMLTGGLKVALRPNVNKDGIVEREEIAKVIKCLMEEEEGKGISQRMRDLKDAAHNALKEYGSSTKALSQLLGKWENMGGI